MSKKIYGDLSATGNIQINGSNTIREINEIHADDTGDITIPYYDKEYIDNMIVMTPISRIGSQDYLPLNVSGSFSGATNYIGKGIYPNVIESDGTLVYLRPGTNGSTFGYYYCYQKNAREVTAINPILTTSTFTPTIFTSSSTLTKFVGSNANDVLMMLCNDGSQDTYIISLTNKTLNPDAHNSVQFPASSITSDPQYAMVNNGIVYIWCIDSYANTSALAFKLYTITVSDVKAGTYSTLQQITGFSGANLYGDAISASDSIQLTNYIFSADTTNKPLYTIPSGNTYRSFSAYWGNTEGSIQAAGNGSNLIRVAWMHACETTTQQNTTRDATAISLVYNVSTKQYTLDTTSHAPVTITTSSSGVITYNNPFEVQLINQIGLSTNSSLNKAPTFFITNDGIQFVCLARHDTSPEHFVNRAKITNFTSLYDSWKMPSRTINTSLLSTIAPQFGSAIGENLIHPTIINSTKVLMHCAGTVNGVNNDYNSTVYTDLGSTRNYSYHSVVNNNTLTGYAPNANRGVLDNSDYRWTGALTIVDSSGATKVYSSSFIEGITSKVSAGLLNQSTMTFSSPYTISSTSLLTTLKSTMLSNSTIPGTVTSSYVALYYVPDGTYTKSYAVLVALNDAATGTNNSYVMLSEVDCTVSSNTITAITPSTYYTIARGITAATVGTSIMLRNGGMIIANYSDFTYVGIPGLFAVSTSSASSYHSLVCKVDNSTKLISTTPKLISTAYNSSTASSYEVGVLPGVGFGVFENGAITDIKTKLVFKNFGTTSAQFDTMAANFAGTPVERIVVASQEVAEGFILYFSQTVPVLINGAYYTIPSTTIDLSTVDSSPASKTFYVYVVENEGAAKYVLSTTLLSEEMWRIYIGTVVTGSSSISTVSIEKVTRFLTYRTSTTQRGSAIPTSTGVPSGTGTRWK